MASPLHAFMTDLCCGAITLSRSPIEIVTDNAVAPSVTRSDARQIEEANDNYHFKPVRPNRIAAKGISYLASVLPPELEPVMRPAEIGVESESEQQSSSEEEKKPLALRRSASSPPTKNKGSRRSTRSTQTEKQARHEKRASKRVTTTAFAA